MMVRRLLVICAGVALVPLAFAHVAVADPAHDSPRTVPPTTPESTVPGSTVPPTLPVALGPLLPVPPGCTGPAPARAVFKGTLVTLDDPEQPTAARFEVSSLLAGTLDGYLLGQRVDVRYGTEARFLVVGTEYIVGVRADEFGALVSTVREPALLFGGDAVIGLNDTDTECPAREDAVRTVLIDGTSVDTGVLSPMRGHTGDLVWAVLKPLLLALVFLILLVTVKLSVVKAAGDVPARLRSHRF